MLVMLVEDDQNLADAIIEYLELDDIECDYANNGYSALELLEKSNHQVLVLDINLPRMDGLTICETLRKDGNDIPIIMLTARDQLEDKLTGFKAGADDYLVKPFAMDELVARIQALSSRVSRKVRKLTVDDLTLDIDKKLATRGNRPLKLSPTGMKLLELLMRDSPKPVSREKLINTIWGKDGTDNNTLKVHIHKLRKDIDPEHSFPLIHNIQSEGYALRSSYADQEKH